MDKLLSILIPVYNCEKTIARCLDSIVGQSGFNDRLDVLIVNDGSNDGTERIVRRYMAKYEQIRLISRDNRGIGPTRNELLDNAAGEYFWFIDGDDYIEKGALSLIPEKLNACSVDMVLLGYRIVDEKGRETHRYTYSGDFESGIDLTAKGFFNNSLWTRIYRLKMINRVGVRFRHYVMAEDFDFIFRLIPETGKVVCLEEIVYDYVMTPHSATKEKSFSHRQKVAEDSLACIMGYDSFFSKFGKREAEVLKHPFNANLIAFLYSIANYCFSWEYKKKVIRALRDSGFIPISPLPKNRRRKIFSVIMNVMPLRYLYFLINHERVK